MKTEYKIFAGVAAFLFSAATLYGFWTHGATGHMEWIGVVALIVIGVLLILAEILSAHVVLSQIGNIVGLCGSAAVAWRIARAEADGSELISRQAIT